MHSTNETNIQRARLIKKGVLKGKRKKKERETAIGRQYRAVSGKS